MAPAIDDLSVASLPWDGVEAVLREIDGSLSIIHGQCHSLVRGGLAAGGRFAGVRAIDREAARIAAAVEHVRDGIADGAPSMHDTECVDLGEAVVRAVARIAAVAAAADVDVSLVAGDVGTIAGRAALLDRVLDHALIGAVVAAGRRGQVTVALIAAGESAHLAISWDAARVGMSTEQCGLGPQIARHLVQRIGGSVHRTQIGDRASMRMTFATVGER